MVMSQSARSASVTDCPSPGASAASAALASAAMIANPLRVDMLGLPLAVDRPTGDDVHMAHREGDGRNVDFGGPAFGNQLFACRLEIAGLVPGAALQHHRLTVP